MTNVLHLPVSPAGQHDDDEIDLITVTLGKSTDLSYAKAVELTVRIGQALDVTESLILHAYLGRAWKALGYGSWDSWVDEQFGTRPLLQIPRQDRASTVIALRQAALSNRMIARILGICERTVRRQLRAADSNHGNQGETDGPTAANAAVEMPSRIVGSNGKRYSARSAPASKPTADRGHRTDEQPPAEVCDWCEEDHATDDCPFDRMALHGRTGDRDGEPGSLGSREVRPTHPRGRHRDPFERNAEGDGQLTAAVATSVRTVETIVVNGMLELPQRVHAIDESVRAWADSHAAAAHLDHQVVSDLATIRGHLAQRTV